MTAQPTAAQLKAANMAPIPNTYAEVSANGDKVRAWNGKNFVVVTQAPFTQQLYAVPDSWEPPPPPPVTYTVTFNPEGGGAVNPITVPAGTSIEEPPSTRSGYTFEGWATSSTGPALAFPYVAPANETLYAQWTPVVPPVMTFTAKASGTSVTVAWTGFSPVELARNGVDSNGGGAWNTGALTGQPTSGSFTFTLLVPGDTYTFIATESGGGTLTTTVMVPVVVPPVTGVLQVGINDHDLMWTAPNAYPISQLKALGAKVHRCDLGAEAQFNTAFNFGDCLGTPGCAGVVGGWASQLRAIDCQPMIVITFTSLPTPSVIAADVAALVKAVPGLWIEIGNELDYNGASLSIPEYVTMFAAVVTAAHESDPTCKIGPNPVANINADGGGWNWLEAAFAAGLASIPYDFLPFHDYPWPSAKSPTTAWAGGDSAETLIPPWIAQCATWGNTKPCWLTEFGWQSTDTSAAPNMTDALQGTYLTEFIQSPEVQALPVAIIYSLTDGGQLYGLIDNSGNEKSAFAAVQTLLTALAT